jgi:cysteine-rich repeat protein
VCGDDVIDAPEECDDGGREPGDGCDESCRLEVDPCEGVVCDSPPPDECATDTMLRQWVGSCAPDTAECVYEPRLAECATDRVCIFSECSDAIEVGEVVISEIMPVPVGGASQQWFEVTSFVPEPVDLSGVVVSGGSRSEGFTIPTETVIPPLGTLVFGASTEAAGGLVSVVWTDHGTFSLSDASDAIELRLGGRRIHRVVYDESWPVFLSASVEREETKEAEELETQNGWCLPSLLYDASGNSGSPRDPEHDCPVCGNSALESGEECDFGDTLPGDGCDAECQSEGLPD